MKWRELLRSPRNTLPPDRKSQEQLERWLADSFRVLGHLCGQLADWVDAQRLGRGGYKSLDRFLERTDERSSHIGNKEPPDG